MTQEFTGKKAPTGLGGWLILWGFGMIIATILFAIQFIQAVQSDASIEMILSAFAVAITLYLIYLYFAKKKAFSKFAITLISLSLLLALFDFLTEPDTFRELFRAFGQAAIWIPYLLISKRVKATFINPGLMPWRKVSRPVMEIRRQFDERQINQ